MDSNELKPCPFCGGEAEEDWSGCSEFYGHDHQSVTIECRACSASLLIDTSCGKDGTPSKGYEFACSCCNDIGSVARSRWNRRAQDFDAMRQRVEAAERERSDAMACLRLMVEDATVADWSGESDDRVLAASQTWCGKFHHFKSRVELLEGLLRGAGEALRHGDFSTGICCCGSPVDSHGFGDGHSPVDEGDYYARGLIERIDAALLDSGKE